MSNEVKEAALRYIFGMRVSCLPLVVDRKVPGIDSWKEYQSRFPLATEVMNWPSGNLGIVTGSISCLVVVDCESREDALWFWHNRGQTTCVAETPRGIHLYFKHPGEHIGNAQRVKDEDGVPRYDIRGDGGYVVAPPSEVVQCEDVKVSGKYSWRTGKHLVLPENLPEFNPNWRPIVQTTSYQSRRITDGVKYIAQIRAVSGSGGHGDTWRAVNVLRESGMDETDALAAMVEWNQTNAEPPWSVGELLHKVRDCFSKE